MQWSIAVDKPVENGASELHLFSAYPPPSYPDVMMLQNRSPIKTSRTLRIVAAIRLGAVVNMGFVRGWIERVGSDLPDKDSPGWIADIDPRDNLPREFRYSLV